MAASTQEQPNDDGASAPEGSASDGADAAASDGAPEASAQSASTAADSGSAGGTTVKIAVYRSSYQLSWDLNDEHGVESLMATWANGTREAPEWWEAIQGSPGSQVECPPEYTRDAEPKRTGYAFLGWSTDPAAPKGQMLDELAIPSDAEISGEGDERTIALYAIWTPIEYSVVFDLTKNPEDASAVPSFSWTTGKGEFSDLGGGRYRLHGITLDDYDPATGLIEIATPSRGTGGYRFLSWAEPESQQDPSVAMRRSGTSKWFVNPVALPHYGYEPVLTARWGLSFDVDVPSQVTFDEYDSLEVEGSLTDSTDKDAIDEESPDAHDAGKQAHFCSQSTATDYRIVALRSVRAASADDVLTTSDSSKATHEEVLGSERLLSMFASADRSESAGVHFRLDDAVDMDQARYSSFVIPRQQAGFDPAATDRDSESRLYVSYRLNLDNRVDGASEPNHGLVSAANVADGARTRIASVSYEFAVADHEVAYGALAPLVSGPTGSDTDPIFVNISESFLSSNGLANVAEPGLYGFSDIQNAAKSLSLKGEQSPYYDLFDAVLRDAGNSSSSIFHARLANGSYLEMVLLGILQDNKAGSEGEETGEKAAFTFQSKGAYTKDQIAPNTALPPNGWCWGPGDDQQQPLRKKMQSYFDNELYAAIVPVVKMHQLAGGTGAANLQTSIERVFLPSMWEVYGTTYVGIYSPTPYNASEEYLPAAHKFQYRYFHLEGPASKNSFWTRSNSYDNVGYFCYIGAHADYGVYENPVAPCFCI